MVQRTPKANKAKGAPSSPSPSSPAGGGGGGGGGGARNTSSSEHRAIRQQWEKAKRAKEAAEAKEAADVERQMALAAESHKMDVIEQQQARIDGARRKSYERRWRWTLGFWGWVLAMHALAIYLFTSGFLLTRLVLDERSTCDVPPVEASTAPLDVARGCWHPKKFDRAVVLVIDALRYDFTVPHGEGKSAAAPAAPAAPAAAYHNAMPFLYESSVQSPRNAFLRPFIADPPTTTLQRLKGLTTGTLPTFIDAGSNFAGTAIDEDNLLVQMRDAGKKIAHVGDDTWWALFPDYFEPNISKPFDSFNVWDLHTVDNGVIDNMLPLVEASSSKTTGGDSNKWDVLIGHCLGVDHAGHRYGPDHAAMTAKLAQMDDVVRRLAASIGDDTLLVVMGDHGMDSKGDHGGESDDEVEAALWMYSKRPVFGRTSPELAVPPATAKDHRVNQIDLVPTLALLLGIPIPYNNLGRPIEEAFIGPRGNDWANLHAVSRMAAAGVERYQASYFKARGISPSSGAGSPAELWSTAQETSASRMASDRDSYDAFIAFQRGTLAVCKDLWARFDVPRMVAGVALAVVGLVVMVMYASKDPDEDYIVNNDEELEHAEKQLELMGLKASSSDGDKEGEAGQSTAADDVSELVDHKELLRGVWDLRVLSVVVLASAVAYVRRGSVAEAAASALTLTLLVVVAVSTTHMAATLHRAGKTLLNTLPTTHWGWMAVVFTVSQSAGFASNSYTVWEDSILLFFITTFGVAGVVAAMRIESRVDRTLAAYHSLAFMVLSRVASLSRLCREEQMPYCTSTYYASATSSTSSAWQLGIPLVVAAVLPAVVRSFLEPTRSWEGLSPVWVRYVFRAGLALASLHWVVDAADNGGWLSRWPVITPLVKPVGMYVAQTGLALSVVAGATGFIWAPPSVGVVSTVADAGQGQGRGQGKGASPAPARVTILGYGNAHGARYLMLVLNVVAALAVLTKPVGTGSLALMLWQVLSLAEMVDLLGLKGEAVGPVVLAMLGNFYYFRTGHQATLASIQWDSAFVALRTVQYPWSPLAVVLNTFGPQILAAAAVPLVSAAWKVGPKQKGVLEAASRSLALFVAYYAVEATATMAWSGHLRRHLMLYRVFSPRFMMAAALLLVVDVLGVGIALVGVRSNTLSVAEVFGFAD